MGRIKQIIGNILTVPYPPHTSVTRFDPGNGTTVTTFNATVPEGLAIMGLCFIIATVLGLILFERKRIYLSKNKLH